MNFDDCKTDAEKMTAIASDFSDTIFWNNVNPWPTENEELYPLAVEHRYGERHLTFYTGKLMVPVATFPKQAHDADIDNVTADADSQFVANLPLYIPYLLARVDALEKEKSELRNQIETRTTIRVAEPEKCKCGMSPYVLQSHNLRDGTSCWSVECSGPACPIQFQEAFHVPNRAEAIRIWNKEMAIGRRGPNGDVR